MEFSEMSDEGQNFFKVIRQARDIFGQVSLLLSTAEALMGEANWVLATAYDVALAGGSTTLRQPRKWMPYELFRFFKNNDAPHIITLISVILDDSEEKGRIEEPLLSAGLFDYGNGNTVGDFSEYWYTCFHMYMPDRRDDGTFLRANVESFPETWSCHFKRVSTFAYPLVDITNAEFLGDKVVSPLLGEADSILK